MKRWTSILSVMLASALMVLVYQNCAEEVDLSKYKGGSKNSELLTVPSSYSLTEDQLGTFSVSRGIGTSNDDIFITWGVFTDNGVTPTNRFENNLTTGTMVLPAGQSSVSFTLKSVKNNLVEANQVYVLLFQATSNSATGEFAAELTVMENDSGAPPSPTVSGATLISAGRDSACGIGTNKLACWGQNNYGQLGRANTDTQTLPATIINEGNTQFSEVSVGWDFACGIRTGKLFCWGRNQYGQLGLDNSGDSNNTSVPTEVPGMLDGVTKVSVGMYYMCAIKAGALYCWGYNHQGQLGTAANNTVNKDQPGTPVPGFETDTLDVSVGGYYNGNFYAHTCAIKKTNSAATSGKAYCWGNNNWGQLGIAAGNKTSQQRPVEVNGLDTGVTKISANGAHTCAIHNGALKCWGYNGYGQLGDGTSTLNGGNANDKTVPTPVNGYASGVLSVSVGELHTCAITTGGRAQCWGFNDNQQLGIAQGNTTHQKVPVDVGTLGANVSEISAGYRQTCAIHAGVQKCWGHNQYRKLGNGLTTNSGVPVTVSFP